MNYVASETADRIELVHTGEPEALEVHSLGPQGKPGDAPLDGRVVHTRAFDIGFNSAPYTALMTLPGGATLRWIHIEVFTGFNAPDHIVSIVGPQGVLLSMDGVLLQQLSFRASVSPLPLPNAAALAATHSGTSTVGSVRVRLEYALP